VTVEERIEALIIQWLHKERGIHAASAHIDEEDWEIQTESSGGCDTCAYRTSYLKLTIWYGLEGESSGLHLHYIEVRKDPLSFLAELLTLEDETK